MLTKTDTANLPQSPRVPKAKLTKSAKAMHRPTIVPNNSAVTIAKDTSKAKSAVAMRAQSCQCVNCENMAKNFFYLEGILRVNTPKQTCQTCSSVLQYVRSLNKNIVDVFKNLNAANGTHYTVQTVYETPRPVMPTVSLGPVVSKKPLHQKRVVAVAKVGSSAVARKVKVNAPSLKKDFQQGKTTALRSTVKKTVAIKTTKLKSKKVKVKSKRTKAKKAVVVGHKK